MRPRGHDQHLAADCAELDRVAAIAAKPFNPPSCARCAHFRRDHINPEAGMGACALGLGYHYPTERHWCPSIERILQ
jgi:hypothetical protein